LVDMDDSEIDEMFDDFIDRNRQYNLEGFLRELIAQGHIDKPNYDPDERWYPSPDDSIVNEYVNDRLNEINV